MGVNNCSFCRAAVFRTDKFYIREFHSPRRSAPLNACHLPFFLSFADLPGAASPRHLIGQSPRTSPGAHDQLRVDLSHGRTGLTECSSSSDSLGKSVSSPEGQHGSPQLGWQAPGPFKELLARHATSQVVLLLRPSPFDPQMALSSSKNCYGCN